MKRSGLIVSMLLIAFVAFAGLASAQEVSVFDEVQKILIRVSITQTGGTTVAPIYSAFLEVRNSEGVLVTADNLSVTHLYPTGNKTVQAEADGTTYKIHDDLTSHDFSMSFDNQDGIAYLVCTNAGLHVMKYNISTSLPMTGTCGYSNGGTFTSAPTTDLCAVGSTASTPTGSGPWYWNCTGANNGSTASCSANIQYRTVTSSAGSGGSISPSTQSVKHGMTTQFTVTPNTGYTATVGGTCGGTPTSGTSKFTYTTNAVTSNCTVSATFAQNTSSGADLTITYFKVPAAGSNGQAFSGYATIANIGTGAAGGFKVSVTMGGQTLGSATVLGLAAGASVTVNFSGLHFSNLALHTYYKITATVDADGQVSETNELNNTFSRDYEVL